jgi:receptor protein-tyrosine kinase
MIALLNELASRYPDRLIIFDSPPLLPTTEARVLASHMGQIIMVVAADTTSQYAVNQALSTIESCEIVLMMLNKARKTDVGSYYGYYTDDGSASTVARFRLATAGVKRPVRSRRMGPSEASAEIRQ